MQDCETKILRESDALCMVRRIYAFRSTMKIVEHEDARVAAEIVFVPLCVKPVTLSAKKPEKKRDEQYLLWHTASGCKFTPFDPL
jgi:hypothetical protein